MTYTKLPASSVGVNDPTSIPADSFTINDPTLIPSSGSAPEYPETLSLYEWWRVESGITQVAAKVTAWTGSKLGKVASQLSGALQPDYNASDASFAGSPASITFAGGGQYLGDTGTPSDYSFLHNNESAVLIVGKYGTVNITNALCHTYLGSGSGPFRGHFNGRTNCANTAGGSIFSVTSGHVPANNTTFWLGSSWDGTIGTGTVKVRGSGVSLATGNSSGTPSADPPGGFFIGGYPGATAGFTVTDVLVFNGDLLAADFQGLADFFVALRGVTA